MNTRKTKIFNPILEKKKETFLKKQTVEALRSKNYSIEKEDDFRIAGKYPDQQNKVEDDVCDRRLLGKPVSVGFLKRQMKKHCMNDKPPGFDPKKDKFKRRWSKGFMKRKGMSLRRKTNSKKLQYYIDYIKFITIIILLFSVWLLIHYLQLQNQVMMSQFPNPIPN